MTFARKARRGAVTALAIAVTALAAGCAGGTPASGPASAHPPTATLSIGAGTSSTVPPVFAASFEPATAGRLGDRLALLSSRTGHLLRWLTSPPDRATDGVLSVRDGWVYFVRYPFDLRSPLDSRSPAIWRVQVTGGRAQLVQAGASDYAISPDGRAVAYVIGADHGNVVEVAVRNLATGRRNTIIMATRPDPDANNWPPEVLNLTWAPQSYDMTAQGQVIWVNGPAQPKGPWTIWRWSGGAPAEIIALPPLGTSPYYGVGSVAW